MMRLALLGVLLLLQAKPSEFDIPHAELQARRERLMDFYKDGVVALDTAPLRAGEAGVDYNTPLFDLKYFTNHHDDLGVLIFSAAEKRTWFFATDVKRAAAASGIKDVQPRAALAGASRAIFAKARKVYTQLRAEAKKIVEACVPPGADISSGVVAEGVTKLRLVKSEFEIKLIRKASDATNKAQLAVMKMLRPGINEALVQKVVEDTFRKEGCPELSFPSICAAGKNGTILHYFDNKEIIPAATSIVCDIGAGLQNYTTDITRTLPTSGRYPPIIKTAYQCVLDAQKAAEAILRPGVTFGDLTQAAAKVFEERGLTDWSYAHSTSGGPRHGLSHFVGMAVHDSGSGAMQPGMVITIEPGYYNKKLAFGIRIEDMYVITKDGFERLSADAPREVDEIEKIMSGK